MLDGMHISTVDVNTQEGKPDSPEIKHVFKKMPRGKRPIGRPRLRYLTDLSCTVNSWF